MGKYPEKSYKNVGQQFTCFNCNETIKVGVAEATADYPERIQYQNLDGSAHFKTEDGKNFKCNIQNPKGNSGPPGEPPEAPKREAPPQQSGRKPEPPADGVPSYIISYSGWWEAGWSQAKRIAQNTLRLPPESNEHRIAAMAIMHDFTTLHLAKAIGEAKKLG